MDSGSSSTSRIRVIRHLTKGHVEAFFTQGTLRLSSFAAFRRLEDAALRDAREGFPVVETSQENSRGVFLGREEDCYVLCTSMGDEVRAEVFGRASGIVISGVEGFAECIARHIPGCLGLMHGPCIYLNDPVLQASVPRLTRPPSEAEAGEEWGRRFHAAQSALAREALFVKKAKYSPEREYRFLWFVSKLKDEPLFIRCPEAREFCAPANGGS